MMDVKSMDSVEVNHIGKDKAEVKMVSTFKVRVCMNMRLERDKESITSISSTSVL